jgi:hypothetical protein
LIDTYLNCKPYWNFLTNMTWMASVPSQDASDSYFSTFFATGMNDQKVQNLYPVLGAHAYGTMNAGDNPSNSYLNTNAMDKAINSNGGTKHIYVTESNFNGDKDWGSKGFRLKNYFQSWGRKAYVDGWVYWGTSQDCKFNNGSFKYLVDKDYNCGGVIPSLPFANQIRTR